MITDKFNLPIGKRKNWLAYGVATAILLILVTGGVFYASGKLADYLTNGQFSTVPVNLK